MARVRNQAGTVEQVREKLFAEGDRLVRLHLVDAGLEPGLLGSLNDESRPLLIELVGVQVEPAPRRFLEGESEGIELFLGAEPDETTLAHVDARIEMALVLAASSRIDTIGADD